MDKGEKSHRTEGLLGSFIFHALILAVFFFFVLTTPNPPLNSGGSGIEVNYGNFEEGYGEAQTKNSPGNNPEESQNIAAEPLPIETTLPPPDPAPIETNPIEPQEVISTENPEDAKIETKKPEKIKEVKDKVKEPEKEVKKVVEEPVKTKSEVKEEGPKSTIPTKTTGEEVKEGGNNNGDKVGKVGDQGNPGGNLNAKALYGNPGEGGDGSGGAGGNKLDMTGWRLAFKLEKKDITNENGKIVYQIKVDDKGELVSIIPIEKTVSPVVEKFYRQQIEDNWAVDRTKDNNNPPPIATGKYTVYVRSK